MTRSPSVWDFAQKQQRPVRHGNPGPIAVDQPVVVWWVQRIDEGLPACRSVFGVVREVELDYRLARIEQNRQCVADDGFAVGAWLFDRVAVEHQPERAQTLVMPIGRCHLATTGA